jgi:hypothetical protein
VKRVIALRRALPETPMKYLGPEARAARERPPLRVIFIVSGRRKRMSDSSLFITNFPLSILHISLFTLYSSLFTLY